MEKMFDLVENESIGGMHFYMNGWFHMKTRFDTEAKAASEVAYICIFGQYFLVMAGVVSFPIFHLLS